MVPIYDHLQFGRQSEIVHNLPEVSVQICRLVSWLLHSKRTEIRGRPGHYIVDKFSKGLRGVVEVLCLKVHLLMF